MIKLALYALLGIVLSTTGINVLDNTLNFLAILGTVVAIDMASYFELSKITRKNS